MKTDYKKILFKFMKYSLVDLIKEYNNRKYILEAYINKQPIEYYKQNKSNNNNNNDNNDNNDNDGAVIAASAAVVIIILIATLINIGLWIWALIATIKFWPLLPIWAQIIAILGLLPILPFGIIITLIVVYVTKNNKI